MAFKMNGFSGFGDKIKTSRAKRLIRKHVEHVVDPSEGGTSNVSDKQFRRSEKKIIKADKLLKKAGYDKGQRERATGSEGVEKALEFAQSKRDKRKKIGKQKPSPKKFIKQGMKGLGKIMRKNPEASRIAGMFMGPVASSITDSTIN